MTHTAPFLNPLMRDKMDLCFPEAKILSTTATADILICHVTGVRDRIAIFSVGWRSESYFIIRYVTLVSRPVPAA